MQCTGNLQRAPTSLAHRFPTRHPLPNCLMRMNRSSRMVLVQAGPFLRKVFLTAPGNQPSHLTRWSNENIQNRIFRHN